MFFTNVGAPAGYGYFNKTTVKDENIIPDMKEHFLLYDPNKLLETKISIGSLAIQTKADVMVQINERAPVLVQPDIGLTFDIRGVYSIKFLSDGVAYNIAAVY